MRMVVSDCSPTNWNLHDIKKSLQKLILLVHPDKNPNTRIWFEAIIEIKELLNNIEICSNLLFQTKREIFYKLGCCEYHLLHNNRKTEYVPNPSLHQFILLFNIHFTSCNNDSTIQYPESINDVLHIMKSVIENKRIVAIDHYQERQTHPEQNQDFSVNIAYVITRSILKWLISKSENPQYLYQELSNLPICKPLESLEEKRKFTEDLILRIVNLVKPETKIKDHQEKKQRSFDDIISLSQSLYTIEENKEKKEKKENKEKEPKKNNTRHEKYAYCVKVPQRKYKSKWYKRALEYGTKHPNKWYPRKILTTKHDYHNMRGTLIIKENSRVEANPFPIIEPHEIVPGLLLMKQDFATRKIYFMFTS
jgi:curved DNA-binding protein CbpA